jgi:hypothetical protein
VLGRSTHPGLTPTSLLRKALYRGVALLGWFYWAVAGEAEQLAKTGHPAGDRGMAGAKVSGWPQPPGELPQPQQGCRPANQLLVSRRERGHLAVAGQQLLPQR